MDAEQLQADAEIFLTEFGEEITYRPAGGTARTILAVVDRNPPEPVPQSPIDVMGKAITIEVANRTTSTSDDEFGGIGSAELDTGRDNVDVVLRLGDSPETRRITNVLSQDLGMLRLDVR